MGCYSILKVFNCVLYLVTLLLAIGYYVQTKFESKFTMYIFRGFFVVRPCLIGLYSLVMICLEMRRRTAKPVKSKKKNKDDSELSDSQPSESMDAIDNHQMAAVRSSTQMGNNRVHAIGFEGGDHDGRSTV